MRVYIYERSGFGAYQRSRRYRKPENPLKRAFRLLSSLPHSFVPEKLSGLSSHTIGRQCQHITTGAHVLIHRVERQRVSRHESRDRVGAGTPSVSRLGLTGSTDRYRWPSLPVQPPVPPPNAPIHPDIHLLTHGCLIPDRVISLIEEIATDRDRDGTELTDHLLTQVFADVVHVHEVRPHTSSPPRHAV